MLILQQKIINNFFGRTSYPLTQIVNYLIKVREQSEKSKCVAGKQKCFVVRHIYKYNFQANGYNFFGSNSVIYHLSPISKGSDPYRR